MVLLLVTVAQGAEMVTNGIFNNSTGWTLSTVTYDSTQTRTAGSGSAVLTASGRNSAVSGTMTQAVSIPAGSTVSAVSLYTQLSTSNETTGDSVTVTLRYADATTVSILSTGELTSHAIWTQRAASPALTLAQNVDQITITMNTKSGASTSATASLWVDELSVTFTASGGSGLASPLMHNSANTSTTYGTWGNDKDCSWCHNDSSTNVKMVEQTISTPTGPKPVIFTRMTASTNAIAGVFGNDQRSYAATASTNVCEVCHHQTSFHRYSANAPTLTHYNNKDCTTCHAHNNAFMASCATCHGNPPASSVAGGPNGMAIDGANTTGFANPGAHVVHAGDPLLGNQGMTCAVCHTNNSSPSHPSRTVQLGFAVNNTTWAAKFTGSGTASYGSYSGTALTSPFTYASSDGGTVVITNAGTRNSCNVYCHGAWANANGSTNPRWAGGSAEAACGTCHGASSTRPPLTGSHVQHAASTTGNYAFSCTKCHSTVTGAGDGHINGSVQWRLSSGSNLIGVTGFTPQYRTATSGATGTVAPSSTFGNCTNIYCHSAGQGLTGGNLTASDFASVQWGNAASVTCGSCHKDMSSNASAPGTHKTHAQDYAANANFKCATCHRGYSATTVTTASHVDRTIYLNFSGMATGTAYGKTSPFAPSLGYSMCSNSYCHSNAQGIGGTGAVTYRKPTWGGAPLGCGGCHQDMKNFTNISSGDHQRHAKEYAFECNYCHGGGYSSTAVTVATHVDKKINMNFTNVAIVSGTSYQKGAAFNPGTAYQTCSNSYCHSNGQSDNANKAIYRTPTWGAPAGLTCGGCHNNMKTFANASSGSHKIHAQTAAYDCNLCHGTNYTSTTVPRSAGSTHVNKKIDLAWTGKAVGMVYSKYSAAGFAPAKGNYGQCSVSACHGGAAAKVSWGADTTRPECFKCHGSTATTGFTTVSSASVAPGGGTSGRDLAGNAVATAPRVGTHQGHLTAATGISDTIHCGECHVKVMTVADATHLNYTTATITFSGRAIAQTHSPSVSRTNGIISCSNTYCHTGKYNSGATMTPAFNNTAYLNATMDMASCKQCHNMPPATTDHTGITNLTAFPATTCSCHSNLSASGTSYANIFTDKAKHINGTIEVSGHSVPYYAGATYNAGHTGCLTGTGCHANTDPLATYPAASGAPDCRSCHRKSDPTVSTNGCGSCHGAANGNGQPSGTSHPDAVGSHPKHTALALGTCVYCHDTGGAGGMANHGPGAHGNTTTNPAIVNVTASQGWNSGAATCSTTYCHSNGQSDSAKAWKYRTTPAWGVAGLSCGSCHNNMKTFANATSGSHVMHAQGNANYDCALCHSGYTATTVNAATHVDKKINLGFNSTAVGTVYSKYSAAGFAPAKGYYGQCSVSVCHGGAAAKITWGADTTRPECMKCHGSNSAAFTNVSAAAIAPGYGTNDGHDLAGNTAATAARVGTHQGHLTAATGISDAIHCGECHVKVTTVADATHLNYTTATITFSGRAKAASHTPTVSRVSSVIRCNNTYCHTGKENSGAAMTPSFNNTAYLSSSMTINDCKQCHGFPPPTSGGHPSATAPNNFPVGSNCNCHNNLSTTGTTYATIFVDKKQHINGSIEGGTNHAVPYYGSVHNSAAGASPFSACTGCHTNTKSSSFPYPQAVGVAPDCQNCHTKASPVGNVTTGCYSCHGSSGASGNSIGRPATSSLTAFPDRAGQHSKHSYTCATCHKWGTGSTRHGWAGRKKTSQNAYSSVKQVQSSWNAPANTGTRTTSSGACTSPVGSGCSSHATNCYWY
jgi:predicted CxxxxCH...CXXCH cytochrome family protein